MEIDEILYNDFPLSLKEIPDPPRKLFYQGNIELLFGESKLLTVVGSRKFSDYGKSVCQRLIEGLSGYPIMIISGLALGIDGISHKAALSKNIKTIAIPGSGLGERVIYPQSHLSLAREIVNKGGLLLSEFESEFRATPWSFPQRNRIMAALSHAVLVVEAEIKSGTLITSKLATEYNKDVLAVPGSIFSKTSEGPNMLIRLGATPIRSSSDILEHFGLKEIQRKIEFDKKDFNPIELIIIEKLRIPMSRDEIISSLEMPVSEVQSTISILEIKGIIKEEMGKIILKDF